LAASGSRKLKVELNNLIMTSYKTLIKKEDILKVENDLIEAMKISDIDTLDKLLHEDLLFITPNGQTITKKMDLDSHRSKTMIIENIFPTIELINVIDDIAIVTIVIDTKGEMLEQPIEGKFRYIRVWKSIQNQLKVVAGSCIQI
jgi:ketosteroid isomerase-like protein